MNIRGWTKVRFKWKSSCIKERFMTSRKAPAESSESSSCPKSETGSPSPRTFLKRKLMSCSQCQELLGQVADLASDCFVQSWGADQEPACLLTQLLTTTTTHKCPFLGKVVRLLVATRVGQVEQTTLGRLAGQPEHHFSLQAMQTI